MQLTLTRALLMACCCATWSQGQSINFGELISRPKDFDGKRVTVRATYRYGFEWQELYCVPSRKTVKVWLAIPPELPKPVQQVLKRLPKHQGTVNATFTGLFHGERSAFGDGGYQFQLDLEKLDQVQIVSKSGAVPEALIPSEKTRVCQSTVMEAPHEAEHAAKPTSDKPR
jgi:hypothetical protein